jgi:murein L,D-transpeptidase YafK
MDELLADWQVERLFSKARLQSEISRLLLDKGQNEQALAQADSGAQILKQMDRLTAKKSVEELDKSGTWDKWVRETIAQSKQTASPAIIVDKTAHQLFLYDRGRKLHTYSCDLGYNSAGQKMFAGDGATPEGRYHINRVRVKGSKYYKALMIDYPNDRDRQRFQQNRARGLIDAEAGIGGLIEIHGEGGRHQDWTEGCIALSNTDIDHLMEFVKESTPVTIVRRTDISR